MPGSKGYKCTPEQIAKMSEVTKETYRRRPELKKILSRKAKKQFKDGRHYSFNPKTKAEVAKKVSASLKKTIRENGHWMFDIWNRPGYREKVGKAISKAKLRQYADDKEFADRHRRALRKPAVRQKSRDAANAYWSTISDKRRQRHIQHVVQAVTERKPTLHEQKLIGLFVENKIPLKYVGDGSFMIGNRCPDFVDKKNKIVLEYDGVKRWHKDKARENQRNSLYERHGWRLVSVRVDVMSVEKELLVKEIRRVVKSNRKAIALAKRGPRLVRVKV